MGSHCLKMVMICKLLVFVTLLLPISISSLSQCNFPAVFNFGDSNSDTGGLSALYGKNVAQSPNGMYLPDGKPDGRRCDGLLLIDYLVKDLELPLLSPYLDSMGRDFRKGANFATIGSTIRRPPNTIYNGGFSPVSLEVQYAEFLNFMTKSKEIRKKDGIFKDLFPSEDTFSKALYTFDIGQNDLTALISASETLEEVKLSFKDIIDNFKIAIEKMYKNAGARYFWIHNTGPAGCLPFVLSGQSKKYSDKDLDDNGCCKPFNGVSEDFNKELKKAVSELRADCPEAAITYVDLYTIKYSIISEAKKSGHDPLMACCGYGKGLYNYDKDNRCGTAKVKESCEDPRLMMNWDGVHFSQEANYLMKGYIKDGSYSDPPRALKEACYISTVEDNIIRKFNDETMNG